MADNRLLDALAQADLILQVDAIRSPYDLFKLPLWLLPLITTRLAEGRAANAGVAMASGNRTGASRRVQEAVERLANLLRNGYNALNAVPEEDVPVAEIADALETYGWEGGNLGDLVTASRVVALAQLTGQVSPSLPAAVRYPANVLSRLTTWLGVWSANRVIAEGGALSTLVDDKDAKRDALLAANMRVRFLYCAASDEGDFTPELARIGDQPRRMPGEAQPQPLPDLPGTATFNPATREMTIPVLPAHATSLIAFRQPAGAPAEQAGVSTTNVVGVADFSPLTAGVTYTLWVVGRNSRGNGPESNRITFTA